MIELTVKMDQWPEGLALTSDEKCRIVRSIVNPLYAQGFGVVSVYFPDGDTNDCDAPISDRHTPDDPDGEERIASLIDAHERFLASEGADHLYQGRGE